MNAKLIIGFVILSGAVAYLLVQNRNTLNLQTTSAVPTPLQVSEGVAQDVTVIGENLDTPWGIAFLPDRSMLITERPGTVRFMGSDKTLDPNPVADIESVREIGEGGLLGIAIHPNFSANNYIYLYYTYSGSGDSTLNRVVRMTYSDKSLSDERVIVDQIPGASNHNGGRIKFGPDNYLYITTGDAQEPSLAQNTASLAGKILRVTDEGNAAPGNPFNNLVYSYGHRNPQGIAWDSNGNLWSTEHGPSGIQSGNDEINRIEMGKNYGWPNIQGNRTESGMEVPEKHSGTMSTWAPGSAAFVENRLYFGGLRGRALYGAITRDGQVSSFGEFFKGEYGRIREAIQGPDGMLYITTSNHDGRGMPQKGDDKIILINPDML